MVSFSIFQGESNATTLPPQPHEITPRPASFLCRPVVALHLTWSAFAMPFFFCLCLDSICHTCPCLYLHCQITQPYHVRQDHLCGSVCEGCPAGSRLYGDCICAAQTSISLLYKGQFKWTVRRRVACRVRVSCLQQPGKKQKHNKQRTIEGPEDA